MCVCVRLEAAVARRPPTPFPPFLFLRACTEFAFCFVTEFSSRPPRRDSSRWRFEGLGLVSDPIAANQEAGKTDEAAAKGT